jgi:ABC-type antimicrobial peptide transport system permease subunit
LPWVRVVGVVKSYYSVDDGVALPAHYYGIARGTDLGDIYYLPASGDTVSLRGFVLTLAARAKSDPQRLPVSLAAQFRIGPQIRYVSTATMEQSLGLVSERQGHDFVASTFTVFAVLAVGLAALGIYGVVAHSVAERRRELGVRLALGASAREIVRVVIREGNPMALGGVALGLYLTKHSVSMLQGYSFDGDEYDVVLFASVAAVMFLVAVAAALIPAMRATRIDPVESLRNE